MNQWIPVVLLFLVGACSSASAPAPSETQPGGTATVENSPLAPDGSAHVLHSERLLGMMQVLRSTRADRLPQELDPGRIAEDAFHEIEVAAAAIQVAARELPSVLPAWGLAAGEREEFEQRAAELGAHGAALEQAARRRDRRAVEREEEAMTATCQACHTRFREGGEVEYLRD